MIFSRFFWALSLFRESLSDDQRRVVALSLQGGGFRAFASDVGLAAGLLAAASKESGEVPVTMAGSSWLHRFSMLSTVSGSSWFASELIYSKSFLSLIESMANAPQSAAKLFGAAWTNPWLIATRVTPSIFKPRRAIAELIVKLLLGNADEDSIFIASYFLSTGLIWDNFVGLLLNSTGHIDQDVLLGSPVNRWAQGKLWLVGHTAVWPTGGNVGTLYSNATLRNTSQVTYVAHESTVPSFYPAKFSVTLGSGPDSWAPVDYTAHAIPFGLGRLSYKGNASAGARYKSETPPLAISIAHANFMRFAGKLPVVNVVSASSAFLGSAAILGRLAGGLQTLVKGGLAPWVSGASDGNAFEVANELIRKLAGSDGISQDSLDDLASAAVHAIVDGGYSDGTGIANSAAAGAEEIFVVMNGYGMNDTEHCPSFLLGLFPDAPPPPNPFVAKELFPVFESPTAFELKEHFKRFHHLELPEKRFLNDIVVGSFLATTATNEFFGIRRGRHVTIHVINIVSGLRIGYLTDFSHYNTLVQEIILAILFEANAAFVSASLLPSLFSQRASQARVSVDLTV